MKPITAAWIIFAICLASILLGASMTANADEQVKETNCTPYKASPADTIYYKCNDLIGVINLKIYLCGVPYKFKIDCKAEVKNEKKD
jgi:hypothetical protein